MEAKAAITKYVIELRLLVGIDIFKHFRRMVALSDLLYKAGLAILYIAALIVNLPNLRDFQDRFGGLSLVKSGPML
jgi:hypothetical protein